MSDYKSIFDALNRLLCREGHLDFDFDYESDRYWVGKSSGRTLEKAIKRATEDQ